MVSWCFQGVKKETGGMKWVKWCYIDFHKDCFKNNSKLEESKSAGMRVCISHMGQSIQEWTKKKLWKVAFKTFLNTFSHSRILCPICLFSCIFRYLLLPWETFRSHIDHESHILVNKKMKQQTSEPFFSIYYIHTSTKYLIQ